MTESIIPGILNTVVGALPSILALVRENHASANPEAPPLTDADVFAALNEAVTKSIAVDEHWKAEHPVTPAEPNDTGE
jgi:hypothetical protein